MLTFAGQGAERALTFVAVALILRVLPVAESGAFVLMLKVAGFTGVLATLGLQAGAVRLISGALGNGDEHWANALLKAFLVTRLAMVIPLILVGFLAGPWIAAHIFGHKSIGIYVTWGFVSAAANAILMFSLHHLQARQSFVKYTALTVLTTASKLAAVALLIIASALSAYRAAAIWALLPACGAVAGIFMAPKAFVKDTNRRQFARARRELTKIGRWLTLSSMVGIIFINLDSLLVARFLGLKAVAWYGAAINLSLMIVIFATSLFTVLLPAVSRLTEIKQVRVFFRRSLLLTSAASILLLPVIAVAPWLVKIVYGARFLPAVPAFRFLFAGALLTIIYSTAGVIFLAMHKPIHVAGQAVAQVLASVPFYIVLIPRIGIVGGAIGTFAGQLAGVAYVIIFGTIILRDKSKPLSAATETEYVT